MKKLNNIFLCGIAMLFSLSLSADNLYNFTDTEKDTVILKFGNNSQIVVYVDSKDDLKDLTNYDINKILEDLNLQVNELNDSVRVLEIKDETGEKYLKDTTVVYRTESKIVTTSGYSSNDDDDKKKYRYTPRSRFDFILDVGLNNYTEDGKFPTGTKLYALNPIGSWYWNLGPTFRTHIAGPVFIDLGLTAALNVHRYNDHSTRLDADPTTGVTFYADTLSQSSKSKLSTWHIQAKAIPMVAFGSNHRRGWRLWNNVDKGFRIGVGPYVGYRIWSRTKYKFNDGSGERKVKKTSNYLLADIRYGWRAQLGFGGFDFFFEYDLNEMFQENQGAPELRRMQFGITF
jgi:hypothetical protein